MKKWLSYIVVAMVCGLCFSSCTKDDEVTAGTDNRNVPVRLTLSLPASTSRAIDAPTEDGALDPTTEKQSNINDVYVLVVDATSNMLKYLVEDLKVSASGNNYNQKILEGTMMRTVGTEQVKLVVLANLAQNNITNVSNIQSYLKSMVGKSITEIYNALVYNYTGPTHWDIDNRGIPMWGISSSTSVPAQGTDLACDLYRAVAKVSIWVNQKEGYQSTKGDFTITGITVNDANDKGYCVSQADLSPVENVQYESPYVTGLSMVSQTFNYTDLNESTAYEDMIYLPEQINSDNRAVTLTVTYNYNGKAGLTGTIEFKKDGTGDRFNVVRNHVYVFNIILNSTTTEITFQYQAMPWIDKTPVDIEFN